MSKSKLGLNSRLTVDKHRCFSETERRLMIEDYLESGLTKQEIWKKYTGRSEEHGAILRWMRAYNYPTNRSKKSGTFVIQKNKCMKKEILPDFEKQLLKNRILELEKQLQDSEMKGIAYQTMIEIAERELNIRIKKKFNTKPSKQ